MDIITYALSKREWDNANQDYKELKKGKINFVDSGEHIEKPLGVGFLTIAHSLPLGIYTISFDYKLKEVQTENTSFFILGVRSLNGNVVRIPYDGEGKSGSISQTVEVSEVGTIMLYGATLNKPSMERHVDFYNVKLEKGYYKTPYTKSPSDLKANNFVVEASQASWQAVDEMNDRILKLENAIVALGGSI